MKLDSPKGSNSPHNVEDKQNLADVVAASLRVGAVQPACARPRHGSVQVRMSFVSTVRDLDNAKVVGESLCSSGMNEASYSLVTEIV